MSIAAGAERDIGITQSVEQSPYIVSKWNMDINLLPIDVKRMVETMRGWFEGDWSAEAVHLTEGEGNPIAFSLNVVYEDKNPIKRIRNFKELGFNRAHIAHRLVGDEWTKQWSYLGVPPLDLIVSAAEDPLKMAVLPESIWSAPFQRRISEKRCPENDPSRLILQVNFGETRALLESLAPLPHEVATDSYRSLAALVQ